MERWSSRGEERRDESDCQSKTKRFSYPKELRITRSAEYKWIIEKGTRHRTDHFHIRMLINPLGPTRLGIAAGKKMGKACVRNWIKRRLREYFRLNRDSMPTGMNIVFIPLRGIIELSTRQIWEELDRFFAEYQPPANMQPRD